MRRLAALLLLAMLSACSSESSSEPEPGPTSEPLPATAPEGALPSPGESRGLGRRPGNPPTCAEVRAGIDAFNVGDFDETVDRFEAAVPLAEAAVDDLDPSDSRRQRAAGDLLEAVVYYAELAPADYPEASLTSSDFARYKQITLSQCAGEGQMAPPEDPGLPA